MTFTDFVVLITPDATDSAFKARVFVSPAGASDAESLDTDTITKAEKLRDIWRDAVKRGTLDEADQTAQELGTLLFNILFPEQQSRHALLKGSLRGIAANPGLGLRIKLRIDRLPNPSKGSGNPRVLSRLNSLPWELLFDPEEREYLNQQRTTPVVRHLSTGKPAEPRPFEPPLRILVAMANPKGSFPLNLERERKFIQDNVANQPGIEVDFIEEASKLKIKNALGRTTPNGQPFYHVFHFMGHGNFREDRGGTLTLHSDTGGVQRVGEDELGELLGLQTDTQGRGAHSGLSLIFLNACETAQSDETTGRLPGSRGDDAETTPAPKPPSPPAPRIPWRQDVPWAAAFVETPWQQAAPWASTDPISTSGTTALVLPVSPVQPSPRPAPPVDRTPWREATPWAPTAFWMHAPPWTQGASITEGQTSNGQTRSGATSGDETAEEPDDFSGTAAELVDRGIPAVVAMQFAISDTAAIAFAGGFYEQLRLGSSVDEAVTVGRKAIIVAPGSKPIEWSTPVLFMRSENGVLFDIKLARILERYFNLEILLNRVRLFWIDGVLKPSLLGKTPITLHMEKAPDAIENILGDLRAALDDAASPKDGGTAMREGKTISQVFVESGSALLILGDPGSGKTTALLELAQALLLRAEGNLKEPVPVVFSLANWSNTRLSMVDWMAAELSAKYQILTKHAHTWFEEHRLVPLLDGLDAVEEEHQGACVRAINDYVQEVGAAGLAVTCRRNEYEALDVRLAFSNDNPAFPNAVRLLPLKPKQIADHAEEAAAGFQAILQNHPELHEQARSPLLLDTMGRVHDSGNAAGPAPAVAEALHQDRLFDTYISQTFARQKEQPFTSANTKRWLGWLAKRMRANHQNIFLIENLTLDWISTRMQRWLSMALFSVILGFLLGLINYIAWDTSDKIDPMGAYEALPLWFWWLVNAIWTFGVSILEYTLPQGFIHATGSVIRRLFKRILLALVYFELWVGLYLLVLLLAPVTSPIGSAQWLIGLLIVGIYTVHPGSPDEIGTVQAMRWSWKDAIRGLVIGVHLGIVFWLVYLGLALSEGVSLGVIAQNLLLYLPLGSIGGALFKGFDTEFVFMKGRTDANQRARLRLRNMARGGLRLGFIFGTACWFIFTYGPFPETGYALPGALLFGFIALLMGALWYGGKDMLEHTSLRALLSISRQMPARFDRFLDYAVRLGFLRKVGGGYLFVNRLLQNHFASKRKG